MVCFQPLHATGERLSSFLLVIIVLLLTRSADLISCPTCFFFFFGVDATHPQPTEIWEPPTSQAVLLGKGAFGDTRDREDCSVLSVLLGWGRTGRGRGSACWMTLALDPRPSRPLCGILERGFRGTLRKP